MTKEKNDWKCCAAEQPEKQKLILVRMKGDKKNGTKAIWSGFNYYLVPPVKGSTISWVVGADWDDIEWKYAEDL